MHCVASPPALGRVADRVRFTLISDRRNRTAVASLLAALESDVPDPRTDLRVVRAEETAAVEFDLSPNVSEVLCLSTMTANAPATIEMHRKLRKRWQTAFTSICGGAHATGDPANLLEAGVDFCCVGEGESVIRAVYARLVQGESLKGLEGLRYLEDGALKGSAAAHRVDIEKYPALPRKWRFPTYMEIGRGCRWACTYCQTAQIHGRTERYRSPARVEETVAQYASLGMKDFRFLLPNALAYMSEDPGIPNCAALEELLARSKRASRGGRIFLGSFPSEVRPDYVTESALQVLEASVSNSTLVIGGQSGSQRVLDSLNRGHSVGTIKRACSLAVSCGFNVSVDLVLGFPGETPEDRRATVDLVEDLGTLRAVSTMHFFMPLPGTPLASAEPVFLSADERRRLDTFGQRGILRGRWRRQEQTASTWKGEKQCKNLFR